MILWEQEHLKEIRAVNHLSAQVQRFMRELNMRNVNKALFFQSLSQPHSLHFHPIDGCKFGIFQ